MRLWFASPRFWVGFFWLHFGRTWWRHRIHRPTSGFIAGWQHELHAWRLRGSARGFLQGLGAGARDSERQSAALRSSEASDLRTRRCREFADADNYLQMAVNWRETVQGQNEPKIADDLLVSVGLCRGMKDYDRARLILLRVMGFHTVTYGATAPPWPTTTAAWHRFTWSRETSSRRSHR